MSGSDRLSRVRLRRGDEVICTADEDLTERVKHITVRCRMFLVRISSGCIVGARRVVADAAQMLVCRSTACAEHL